MRSGFAPPFVHSFNQQSASGDSLTLPPLKPHCILTHIFIVASTRPLQQPVKSPTSPYTSSTPSRVTCSLLVQLHSSAPQCVPPKPAAHSSTHKLFAVLSLVMMTTLLPPPRGRGLSTWMVDKCVNSESFLLEAGTETLRVCEYALSRQPVMLASLTLGIHQTPLITIPDGRQMLTPPPPPPSPPPLHHSLVSFTRRIPPLLRQSPQRPVFWDTIQLTLIIFLAAPHYTAPPPRLTHHTPHLTPPHFNAPQTASRQSSASPLQTPSTRLVVSW
ncbi:unnamed protein product [Taenia asiatica]|uniref:Uncharacterized protein n=1 Tax=Taenia asiatica TaxID=60517 RepID=A0A0R3VYU7_TAEAS|nr:unnamed protein product [Taenia asiatica]